MATASHELMLLIQNPPWTRGPKPLPGQPHGKDMSVLLPQCWENVASGGLSILSACASMAAQGAGEGWGRGGAQLFQALVFLPVHPDIWVQDVEQALTSDRCWCHASDSTQHYPTPRKQMRAVLCTSFAADLVNT